VARDERFLHQAARTQRVRSQKRTPRDFARSFDRVTWSPPTSENVSRTKLDAPPATPAEITAAFGRDDLAPDDR
jgi:hypothetical protein